MRNKRIRLGHQTSQSYNYASKIDLGKDLIEQIEDLQREEEIREKLNKKIEDLRKIISGISIDMVKNKLDYYYIIGRELQFVDENPFNNVEMWSILRIISQSIDSLPNIQNPEVRIKHLAFMYYLGKVSQEDLNKATWSQWFEITKFPKIFSRKDFYKKVLNQIKNRKISDKTLREFTKTISENSKTN